MRGRMIAAMAAGALILLAGGTDAARAHAIWLAERAGELTLVYGVGPQDEAYLPDKAKSVAARAANGEPRPASFQRRARNAAIEAPRDAAIFATVLDNGFWTKGADGKYVNASKSTVPNPGPSSHTIKLNVHIRAATGGAPKPHGLTLEIVPLVDVHPLKPGDPLPVQVLFGGKPLPRTALFPDYVNDANIRGARTDAEGKAVLSVRNHGLNVIGVAFRQPTPDSRDADAIGYFATLSFVTAFTESD